MFTTFSTLVRALQEGQVEPAANSDEDEATTSQEAGDDTEGGSAEEGGRARNKDASAAEDATPVLSTFFGIANTVVSTVQARTTELVNSVKETDWAGEIEAFKKELQEDTTHIVHSVETSIEQLPEQTNNQDLKGTLLQVQNQIQDIGRSLFAGTQDFISQVNDALQEELQSMPGNKQTGKLPRDVSSGRLPGGGNAKYSRYEAEVSAMQRDSSTYCDEPEDTEDFEAWLGTFNLDERKDDIEELIKSNAFMAELQARIVPLIVEYADFWTRYFYRLYKLQQKHEQRAQVVQRAMQQREEEQISWDDDGSEAQSPKASTSSVAATAATSALAAVDGLLSSDDDDDDSGLAESLGAADDAPETPTEATAANDAGEPAVLAADADREADAGAATVEAAAADDSPTGSNDASPSASHAQAAASKKETADMETSAAETSPKAATASEGSSGDPWCVVTSPSHKAAKKDTPFKEEEEEKAEAEGSPRDAGTDAAEEAASAPVAAESGEADAADEKGGEEEIGLDASDAEPAAAGEGNAESDIDEDWGLD